MNEQKIRKVITRFVELYKEDPDRIMNDTLITIFQVAF